jgi:hypothetical protein
MINCFQIFFNFAFSFNLRRHMKAVMGVLRTHQAGPTLNPKP